MLSTGPGFFIFFQAIQPAKTGTFIQLPSEVRKDNSKQVMSIIKLIIAMDVL